MVDVSTRFKNYLNVVGGRTDGASSQVLAECLHEFWHTVIAQTHNEDGFCVLFEDGSSLVLISKDDEKEGGMTLLDSEQTHEMIIDGLSDESNEDREQQEEILARAVTGDGRIVEASDVMLAALRSAVIKNAH